MDSRSKYDLLAVVETVRVFCRGHVTEVRALEATTATDRRPVTLCGYFDNVEQLAVAVSTIETAKGIYFVPNAVDVALLGRAHNRIRPAPKGESTQDTNIVRRLWLLIDADAVRPSGISSTDAEHMAALQRVQAVRDFLKARGWPEPIVADSGNGGHLPYHIDLPADDGGLVAGCLQALAARFDDERVRIDTSVFNAARIWKMYGTPACKGDNTVDRPHRPSKILWQPAELVTVPVELLEALAAEVPHVAARGKGNASPRYGDGSRFDLAAFIQQYGLEVDGPETWQGQQGSGQRWVLRQSPMCEHHDGAAFLLEHASGAITAHCHHNSCSWGWQELRAKFEAGRRERRHNGQIGKPPPASPVDWPAPKPLPTELPVVAPFEDGLLPEKFRPWIRDTAERIQCPADFPAVAAMVGLAAIVGRKVGIRPKRRDDWLVVPNLWGALIGRPGVMKTPAIVEPIKPLNRLEIEAKRAFQAATKEHAALALVLAANRKHQEREIGKLASKDSSGALALAQSLVQDDEPAPLRRRYIVNDSTVEKLGEILNENPNGVLIYRDELIGLLRGLDKEGQEGSRAFYLEGWNGTGRYTYDRIGRGTIDIESAILSIIGGIQPGPFRDYMREAVRGGKGDDGLMQRFQLAVWPDTNQPWRNVDRWPDTKAQQIAFDVFETLPDLDPATIGADTDDHDPDGIPFLRFDGAAQDEFDTWRMHLENRLRSEQDHPAVESHLAKYRSLIPSLALLIHLADTGRGPVGITALQKAMEWGTYLESHARRIYSVAVNPDVAAAKTLAKKLLAGELSDGFARRDVYRNGWTGLATRDEAAAATELLIDLDWLLAEEQRTEGRPAIVHFVNPKIHEPGPHRTDKTDKRAAEGASGGSVSSSPGTLPDFEADGTTEGDGWGEV